MVSVSMPVLNGAKHIRAQLEALELQSYAGPWEVVVVDNGSTDGTPDVVREVQASMPNLTLVEEPRRGIGRARNKGVEASSGDWLLFVDADDIVADRWMEMMVAALAEHPFVCGSVESAQLNEGAAERFNPFASPEDPGPKAAFDFLPFAPTGNLGIWRSAFEDVGGFQRLTGSGSDVDLSWRLLLAGYELHFEPDAVIYYRFRESVGATLRQSMFYAEAHPYLYSRFGSRGMPRPPLRQAVEEVRRLAKLGIRLPDLSPRRREQWLRDVGNFLGRIKGSLRYRTLYL
jgi:glycosyltransferase involved in cell wall biosynthesis